MKMLKNTDLDSCQRRMNKQKSKLILNNNKKYLKKKYLKAVDPVEFFTDPGPGLTL